MKRCQKCIHPETKPGITFNLRGICNACQSAEHNDSINWDLRWQQLEKIANQTRVKKSDGYNILIPVSGGKDSTYLAVTAKNRLKLNPLCVNVAPCEPTDRGERNLANLSKLGLDVFRFFPNKRIMPTLVKRSFYEDGDPCTSHEFMLYGVPLRMAVNFKIPLIMWAENSRVEYGNFDLQCGLWGRSHTHWIGNGVTEKDLVAFEQPTEAKDEAQSVKAIYLSDYVRWDSRKVAEFAIEYGLETRKPEELLGTGGYWDFEQLDDESPAIGHFLKYQKFGYGRATDQACRDIRLGHVTREQGLKLAEQYDGRLNEDYVERFCKYINITRDEFTKVCAGFYRNPVKV